MTAEPALNHLKSLIGSLSKEQSRLQELRDCCRTPEMKQELEAKVKELAATAAAYAVIKEWAVKLEGEAARIAATEPYKGHIRA